jgi:hypothetical protein
MIPPPALFFFLGGVFSGFVAEISTLIFRPSYKQAA